MRDALLDLATGAACLACARPGRALCPACRDGAPRTARRTRPRPCPPGLVPVYTAGDYEAAMRELVLAHKERAVHALAAPLGEVLAHVVLGVERLQPGLLDPVVWLVPVPSHRAVVRARGHDPVLRIARRAAHELRRRGTSATVRRLLGVVGRPEDQAGLGAEQRRANLEGRFRSRAPSSSRVTGAVLLLDDVVTSGATLREAQRALEESGWSPRAAVTLAATRRRLGVPDSGAGG